MEDGLAHSIQLEVNNNYTEANSWQYSFYVPQDIETFIQKMGGKEAFEAKLDALFQAKSSLTGREQVDITGLIGQYAHGNDRVIISRICTILSEHPKKLNFMFVK